MVLPGSVKVNVYIVFTQGVQEGEEGAGAGHLPTTVPPPIAPARRAWVSPSPRRTLGSSARAAGWSGTPTRYS